MKITIAKVNRQLREGFSQKTKKEYSFTSLGIAPAEDKLTDINGIEFERDGRWLNGTDVPGVTDEWNEGDVVLVNLIQKQVTTKSGETKTVINFKLPEGVDPLISKKNSVEIRPDPTETGEEDF